MIFFFFLRREYQKVWVSVTFASKTYDTKGEIIVSRLT